MRSPHSPAPPLDDDPIAGALRAGAARLDLSLTPAQLAQLLAYQRLLAKWSRVYNLTAVRDPARVVSHHLLDALAIKPFVMGPRVLDAGTGAGLPGLPLAVILPEWHFTLLDANQKKSRFVTQAVVELGLHNVDVASERIERYRPQEGFTTVVTRALGSVAETLELCSHTIMPGGRFLAMKGARPDAELAALPVGYRVLEIASLEVPGVDAPRHVVSIATMERGT